MSKSPPIKLDYVVLCDQTKREDNGKLILLGVYTGDILLRLAKLGGRFAEVPLVLQYGENEGERRMRIGRTVGKTLGLMVARRFERTFPQ